MQRFEKIKREFGGSTENGSEISLPPTVDSIDGDTGRNGVILSEYVIIYQKTPKCMTGSLLTITVSTCVVYLTQ